MKIDAELGNKIQELQIFEQNLQNILMQKQAFQIEFNEIENAISELKKTEDEVYKVVGGIMLRSDKASLNSELEEKKKLLKIRIDSLEKQNKLIEDKAEKLKKDVNSAVSEKKD